MRIVVFHDEPDLLEKIRANLQPEHSCHFYADAVSLLNAFRRETFDLFIAGRDLPGIDGIEVIQRVREMTGQQLPILVVTDSSHECDVIEALASGADDYMVKPVRTGELAARVSALLRRAHPRALSEQLVFGPYRFDAEQRNLTLRGELISLNNREYDLALFLFRNAGRLLSRGHLREAAWGEYSKAPSRSIDTHISRLRTRLCLTPDNGFTIHAFYGTGYRLDGAGLMRTGLSPRRYR